jgi:hypothetical protein
MTVLCLSAPTSSSSCALRSRCARLARSSSRRASSGGRDTPLPLAPERLTNDDDTTDRTPGEVFAEWHRYEGDNLHEGQEARKGIEGVEFSKAGMVGTHPPAAVVVGSGGRPPAAGATPAHPAPPNQAKASTQASSRAEGLQAAETF